MPRAGSPADARSVRVGQQAELAQQHVGDRDRDREGIVGRDRVAASGSSESASCGR